MRILRGRKSEPEADGVPNGPDPEPPDDLPEVLGGAAGRIGEVVAAATWAAEEIRREAEVLAARAPAPGVIDRERLAAELVATLVERADELRSQAIDLSRILNRAARQLEAARNREAAAGARGRRFRQLGGPAGRGATSERWE